MAKGTQAYQTAESKVQEKRWQKPSQENSRVPVISKIQVQTEAQAETQTPVTAIQSAQAEASHTQGQTAFQTTVRVNIHRTVEMNV
jgi:predicted transcriptional regulator